MERHIAILVRDHSNGLAMTEIEPDMYEITKCIHCKHFVTRAQAPDHACGVPDFDLECTDDGTAATYRHRSRADLRITAVNQLPAV